MRILAFYRPLSDQSETGREIRKITGPDQCFFFHLPHLDSPLPVGSIIKISDIAKDVEEAEGFNDGDVWFKVVGIEYEEAKRPYTVLLQLSLESYFDIGLDILIKCLYARGKE